MKELSLYSRGKRRSSREGKKVLCSDFQAIPEECEAYGAEAPPLPKEAGLQR